MTQINQANDEVMTPNNHPPNATTPSQQLQDTWDEFKAALYAPANSDFDPFYWCFRLARVVFNYLLRQKLRRIVPWIRPIM